MKTDPSMHQIEYVKPCFYPTTLTSIPTQFLWVHQRKLSDRRLLLSLVKLDSTPLEVLLILYPNNSHQHKRNHVTCPTSSPAPPTKHQFFTISGINQEVKPLKHIPP
uniref:Putative ovule protein n=1 Tax=Solanum chacoense TaxID=4108 RepID=A0A0V0IH39_SOLCH